MTTFLEQEEVEQLTNKIRRHSQVKVLRAMGIEHKVRPDGTVAILRTHIEKAFDGDRTASPSSRQRQPTIPNWDAL